MEVCVMEENGYQGSGGGSARNKLISIFVWCAPVEFRDSLSYALFRTG